MDLFNADLSRYERYTVSSTPTLPTARLFTASKAGYSLLNVYLHAKQFSLLLVIQDFLTEQSRAWYSVFHGHSHQLARYLTVRHSEWAFVPVDKAGITDSLSR
jgi:hypothetical protein